MEKEAGVSFVSTLPPTICGTGNYVKFLTNNVPGDK
jgi:hypothetical protein